MLKVQLDKNNQLLLKHRLLVKLRPKEQLINQNQMLLHKLKLMQHHKGMTQKQENQMLHKIKNQQLILVKVVTEQQLLMHQLG